MRALFLLAVFLFAGCGNADQLYAPFALSASSIPPTPPVVSCPYGSTYDDGCAGAFAGTPQYPHLIDTSIVTALKINYGYGYTDGTYNWTTTGGGGSGATGTITVAGGILGGLDGSLYTISNNGSAYTSAPTIVYSAPYSNSFEGYIYKNVNTPTLVVTAVNSGGVFKTQGISGSGITANTKVYYQLTGITGGVGTYVVTIDQTVGSAGSPVSITGGGGFVGATVYTGTPHNAATTWNVAGVDYAVGVPAGTALKDPTVDALPTGCSLTGTTVTCTGNNRIIEGYDFSLHSTNLSVSGSNNTITKNNFGGTVCNAPQIRLNSVGTTTITYNTIDGGGYVCTTPALGAIIYGTYADGAVITRKYNWVKNAPEDFTKNAGPSTGSATIIDKYNLFEQQGWTGHPDGIQLNGGNISNSFYSFNTYLNRDLNLPVLQAQGTQPVHLEAQLNANVANYTVNNNVIITPGNGWETANIDIACKVGASGTNTNDGFSAYGNYIDATGTVGGNSALSNGYNCTNTSWGTPTPNYNIVTGATWPAP